jgi:hypothetical protein
LFIELGERGQGSLGGTAFFIIGFSPVSGKDNPSLQKNKKIFLTTQA